jgi:micrococcal nuclease
LAGGSISARDAKDHVGENATVCGTVASAKWASGSRGSPTFLNLDEPYPNQIFTVVIWGSDRSKFGQPEKTYEGKRICVTGLIKSYRGQPEIAASNPSQITAP